MKILSANYQQLVTSFSVAVLLSACASNAPAPIQSTTVIGSKPSSSQSSKNNTRPTLDKPTRGRHGGQLNSNGTNRLHANFDGYICEDAPRFIGKSIGDGECVDLIKLCSNAPLTRYWKPGDYAFGKDIPAG